MATEEQSSDQAADRAKAHTQVYAEHIAGMAQKHGVQKGRKITTAEEAEQMMVYWERRGQSLAYLVTPELGYDIHTLFTFVVAMDPRTTSEIHRHMNEAVIHILEGSGYTVFDVDGEKVEWKQGDTLSVPQWAWHQHFNPGDKPAKYLATINKPLMDALGLFKIEDYAPDEKEQR